jgi:hypothetical protein
MAAYGRPVAIRARPPPRCREPAFSSLDCARDPSAACNPPRPRVDALRAANVSSNLSQGGEGSGSQAVRSAACHQEPVSWRVSAASSASLAGVSALPARALRTTTYCFPDRGASVRLTAIPDGVIDRAGGCVSRSETSPRSQGGRTAGFAATGLAIGRGVGLSTDPRFALPVGASNECSAPIQAASE